MATFAARRLQDISDNTAHILAVELLAAAQGLDFRRPLKSSPTLEQLHATVRRDVSFYSEDRYFSPDIEAIGRLILSGELTGLCPLSSDH